MKCLTPVQLEDYAEGLLSGPEADEVERHARGCPSCLRDLEERRRWLEACRTLPPLKLPSGFTRRVMEAAFPVRARRPGRVIAWAAGLASLALAAVLVATSGATGLSQMLASSSRLLWRGLQEGASFCAKAARLILALLKVGTELVQSLGRGLQAVTESSSAQLQVLAAASVVLLLAISYFGYRKIFVRR